MEQLTYFEIKKNAGKQGIKRVNKVLDKILN